MPKVAPFLDTNLSANHGWPNQAAGAPVDLGTTTGKDDFVTVYSDFYKDYYSVNTDAYADSYIAQLSGRPLMSVWQLWSSVSPQPVPPGMIQNVENSASLTRADVQSRLQSALGTTHPLFNNMSATGTFIIGSCNGDQLSFRDEVLTQFESNGTYYNRATWDPVGLRASSVKPGFWNQNVTTGGDGMFLPRAGGSNYTNAWTSAQNNRAGYNGVKHVNVESWNEYDEGSGIYAANTGAPYIAPGSGNTNTDTWSSATPPDPYQYIKTTAAGARQFNDTADLGSTILYTNLPTAMGPGQTLTVQVVVRNDGDLSWTNAAGFKLGERSDTTMFNVGGCSSYDTDPNNEISQTQDYGYGSVQGYGGIFRGRPVTLNLTLTAPATFGTYTTHWQMEENGAWFGQELTAQFPVALYGDANLDGRVDVSDLAILAANYRKQVTGGWSMGDFNDDGVVDVKDLALLAANYRQTLGSTAVPAYDGLDAAAIALLSQAGVTAVPEPGVLVLLGTGLVGVLVYVWRKRRRFLI